VGHLVYEHVSLALFLLFIQDISIPTRFNVLLFHRALYILDMAALDLYISCVKRIGVFLLPRSIKTIACDGNALDICRR